MLVWKNRQRREEKQERGRKHCVISSEIRVLMPTCFDLREPACVWGGVFFISYNLCGAYCFIFYIYNTMFTLHSEITLYMFSVIYSKVFRLIIVLLCSL